MYLHTRSHAHTYTHMQTHTNIHPHLTHTQVPSHIHWSTCTGLWDPWSYSPHKQDLWTLREVHGLGFPSAPWRHRISSCCSLLLRQCVERTCHVRSRPSQHPKSPGPIFSHFPASRAVILPVVYKLPSLWHLVMAAELTKALTESWWRAKRLSLLTPQSEPSSSFIP